MVDLKIGRISKKAEDSAKEKKKIKHPLTRLISDSAAISDPTGVMYPDKLCSHTQWQKYLSTKTKSLP